MQPQRSHGWALALTCRVILGLTLVGAMARVGNADELTATLGEPLLEVSHHADVRIADGLVTYKVQRVFANRGSRAEEAVLLITLPPGAVATGLRIRARDQWHDAELLEREEAARRYQELTGRGAWALKDPALLSWLWTDQLALQIFPVVAGSSATVEYTLTAPTDYRDGRVFLAYPRTVMPDDNHVTVNLATERTALALATPIITVRPTWGDAGLPIELDGVPVTRDAPLTLAAPTAPVGLEGIEPSLISADASHTVSTLAMPRALVAGDTLAIDVRLRHSYRGDLEIRLIAPDGGVHSLIERAGGSENDIRQRFRLPLAGPVPAGRWRLWIADVAALDSGALEAWSIVVGETAPVNATDVPKFIADAPKSASDAGLAQVSIKAPPIDVVAARLGHARADTKLVFNRLELDVAAELSSLPRGASVVFVLDASRSESDLGIAGQVALIDAYLRYLPDAHAEVIVARRFATRLFGRWLPSAGARDALAAALAAGRLDRRNGSNADVALAMARDVLADRPGPQRILLLTDDLLPTRLSTPTLSPALAGVRKDAVIHVVVDQSSYDIVELTRDDAHPLAPLATLRHGILVRADGLHGERKQLGAALLGLVRPTRLDYVEIDGLTHPDIPSTLDEGTALRLHAGDARAATSVTVRGKLWSTPWQRVVQATPAFSRATAGFTFSADLHHDLTPAQMMRLAMTGRAVSPVTSYLAVEPGTRPSTEGIERGESFGLGSRGFGAGGGSVGRYAPGPPAWTTLLAPALRRCAATHRVTGWQAAPRIETTLAEIVDVTWPVTSPRSTAMETCVGEAIWQLTEGWDVTEQRATHSPTLSVP